MNFLKTLIASLVALPTLFMGASAPTSPTLGSAVPSIQALFETSLQASITSNATSATLVSGLDIAGNNLLGYYCFTVDAGTPQNEFMCGNASGTALTNLVRGVNPALGITANTSLQFAHRRGADVKMTDAPYLSIYSNIFNGTQSIPAVMSYDPALASTSTIGSNVNNIPTVGYVNSAASSGAPDASFSQKGLIQLATTSQSLVGTATSSATTYLVVPNSAVNQSSTANKIPIADANGHIDGSYLGSSTISVTSLTSASTTLNGTTTVSTLILPNQTSSILQTNANGSITGVQISNLTPQRYISANFATTTAGGATTSTLASLTIPAATTSSVYYVQWYQNSNGSQNATTTLQIGGTSVVSCNMPLTGGGGFFIMSMQGSTSSEFISGNLGCAAVYGDSFTSINMSATTTWKLFAATPSVYSINGALSVFAQ